ncbi:hypothetical protein [Methanoculleus sp.]|uniref:hypothetical protein n=1 Tax=Methanoculleus sp. TaxID=90427 RepID=UPI0025DCA7A7|nr:hypothetical protein [Methanoculleus sp.]MCK9320000.1 hypothetical protein [Methanoculleus sp.]
MIPELFERLVLTDNAKIAHYETVKYLENLGFECQKEYRVPDRGDGRSGRIDIIAFKGNLQIAIEIDRLSPRAKSIYKLKELPDGFIKCVICRKVAKYRKVKDFHFIYPSFVKECPPELKRTWVKKKKVKKNFEKKFRLINS